MLGADFGHVPNGVRGKCQRIFYLYMHICVYIILISLSPHFPWVGPSLVCHIRHAIPSIYSHEGKTSTGFRHTHSVLTLTSDSPKASCHQLPVSLLSVLSPLVFLHRVSSCKYPCYFYIVFHEPFELLKYVFVSVCCFNLFASDCRQTLPPFPEYLTEKSNMRLH